MNSRKNQEVAMLIEAEFNCAYCGALNVTTVDPSAGSDQDYVEDCQICCKPNDLKVQASGPRRATIEARQNAE